MLKIKYRYKLVIQTPETMKLFGSTKKGENLPSLEVVEVALAHCNLVVNQYQQKSKVSYISINVMLIFQMLNQEI